MESAIAIWLQHTARQTTLTAYFDPQPVLDYGVFIPAAVTEYWIQPLGQCITYGTQQRHLILEQCVYDR